MKRLLSLFVLVCGLALSLNAQELILRAGTEVYQYNEQLGKWSENPLKPNAILHYRDSIKSYTSFTLEVPRTWRNFFSKRVFTYIKYPEGVRIDNKLVEKADRYSPVDTRSVVQGGGRDTLISHLVWIWQNAPDYPSSLDVDIELFKSDGWEPIEADSSVTLSTPITISIINKEAFDVYAFVLCKDNEWSIVTAKCITPFSVYDEKRQLTEPLGKQEVFLVCTKDPKCVDELLSSFLSSFDDNH